MGIDVDKMFGDAWDQAKQGMNDLLNQGGNAGLGYLEGQAIGIIQADKAQHEQAAKDAIAQTLARPTNPNSFGAYLSNLASAPAIKQYGPYILAGGVVLLFVGFYLRK